MYDFYFIKTSYFLLYFSISYIFLFCGINYKINKKNAVGKSMNKSKNKLKKNHMINIYIYKKNL